MRELTLKITETAIEDMSSIFSYIALDNLSAAKELVNKFYTTFENLLSFPDSGFVKGKYIKRDVRIFVIAKHYQIIYRVQGKNLFILRVLTGYQNVLMYR